jgi:hypothetical protein
MNPAGLIVQEKGTKRENSSELKQEQVWNHTEVRKGSADEDKKKNKMPVETKSVKFLRQQSERHATNDRCNTRARQKGDKKSETREEGESHTSKHPDRPSGEIVTLRQ